MLARVVAAVMRLRFDATSAEGLDATLALAVRLALVRRIVPLRVAVRDGRCEIRPGAAPHARARVEIGLLDMIRVGLDRAPWPALLASGRLELTGDPFVALRFPTLFGVRAVGYPAGGHPRAQSLPARPGGLRGLPGR